MKTIIIITLALIGLLGLNSCEDRINPLRERNQVPQLLISNYSNLHSNDNDYYTVLNDSCKSGYPYLINYSIEEEQAKVEFSATGFQGELLVNEETYNADDSIRTGYGSLELYTNDIGFQEIIFCTTDAWNEVGNSTLNLMVFDNLPPVVASISVNNTAVISPFEREIVATNSYDRDALYGGTIIWYEYVIGTDTTVFPYAKMNYVFPGSGVYNIGVRVMDNDSAWSNSSSISYTVN